jgi:hypothetical protein
MERDIVDQRGAQVRTPFFGANPSASRRADSGISKILCPLPVACLSRSCAVHSDSILHNSLSQRVSIRFAWPGLVLDEAPQRLKPENSPSA